MRNWPVDRNIENAGTFIPIGHVLGCAFGKIGKGVAVCQWGLGVSRGTVDYVEAGIHGD